LLLLLAIGAATTTLTLGLALNGVTGQHYAATRAATRGPDVVASTLSDPGSQRVPLAGLQALTRTRGVAAHSGPYPVTFTSLRLDGRPENASVMVEGRDQAAAPVDQPTAAVAALTYIPSRLADRADVAPLRAADGA
jgi:hypothetical protein